MEVQKVIIIDLQQRIESQINLDFPVKDRRFYLDGKNVKLKALPPIKVNNDSFMVREGYRNPRLIIDYSVFKKTHYEKQELKKAKSKYKRNQIN